MQTSWGSRADGDANDSHRMSPRARRSDSVTSPPPNHPGLVRYKDEVQMEAPETFESSQHTSLSEKSSCALLLEPDPYPHSDDEYNKETFFDESNLDSASDASYDANDSHDDD